MKKHLHCCTSIILLVFLISCKEQDQTKQQKNNTELSVSKLPDVIVPIKKVDTTFALNAPSRITRRIRKDAKGNLLIAAYTDVILYDGVSFSKLPKPDGLESFDAFDALEDTKGNIWIASTHYGVLHYDGKGFKHYTTANGLAHNRTIDLHEDRVGNIWIATMGGASRFDGTSFHNYTTKDGLTDNDVNSIIEDKTGKIWLGTRGSACVYDGEKFETITDERRESFTNIRHIIEDTKGHIWLGGSSGLWQYDGITFTNFSRKRVVNMYEDKKGNIWTISQNNNSSEWGLSMHETTPSSNGIQTVTEIEMADRVLFGISGDEEGNIWVGSGSGVFTYDGTSINHFIKSNL